jgi:hypothetical protein
MHKKNTPAVKPQRAWGVPTWKLPPWDQTGDLSAPRAAAPTARYVKAGQMYLPFGLRLQDRAVPNGERTRWSLVYELSPIQFVQIRTGLRYPMAYDSEHRRQYFVKSHGFF